MDLKKDFSEKDYDRIKSYVYNNSGTIVNIRKGDYQCLKLLFPYGKNRKIEISKSEKGYKVYDEDKTYKFKKFDDAFKFVDEET